MRMGFEFFSQQKFHWYKIGENANLVIPITIFLCDINVFGENFPV